MTSNFVLLGQIDCDCVCSCWLKVSKECKGCAVVFWSDGFYSMRWKVYVGILCMACGVSGGGKWAPWELSWWDLNTCSFVGKWSLEWNTFKIMLKFCLENSKLEQFEIEWGNEFTVREYRQSHTLCSNLFALVLFLFSNVWPGSPCQCYFSDASEPTGVTDKTLERALGQTCFMYRA